MSVFAAIFCGVLIGALIGSEIETSLPFGDYFWAVGALVGGLCAYCTVDFGHFKVGVTNAWTVTEKRYKKIRTWRPYGPYWKAIGAFYRAGFALLATAVLYCVPEGLLAVYAGHWLELERANMSPILYWPLDGLTFLSAVAFFLTGGAAILCCAIFTLAGPFADLRWNKDDWEYTDSLEKEYRFALSVTDSFNPVAVAKSAWKHFKDVPHYAKTAGAFLWLGLRSTGWFIGYTIAFVHSQARIICLVDTALFVVVAHFLGFTLQGNLIAAAAGGIFGVLNYLVVGVWLLKLVPTRVSTS